MEVERAADALIAARPDSMAIDAAAGDNCCYPSNVGHFYDYDEWAPQGSAGLVKAGHDPLGIVYARLRTAGIPTLAGFRMNDHHGCGWTPWMQAHILWSLGKDTGDRGWRAIGTVNRPRLEHFLRHHRPGLIATIIRDDEPFRHPDTALDAYAAAWALAHHLLQTRKPEFVAYLRSLAAKRYGVGGGPPVTPPLAGSNPPLFYSRASAFSTSAAGARGPERLGP